MADQQSNIKIIIQTIKQGEGDKEATAGLGDLKSGLGDLSQKFLGVNLATLGFAGALFLLEKQLATDVDLAAKDQSVMASLSVTMEDMGRGGSAAAEGIQKTALQLQDISTFDHTSIEAAYNAIAKFETIPTGDMDRIVKDAMDMSAAMGGDLASNAETVARVMETGVIPRTWGFSVALREAIKAEVDAGDTTKALNDTLGMLEQRFGGQSAAQLNTYSGQVQHLDNDFKNLEEEVGKGLLPVLTRFVEALDLIVSGKDKIEGALHDHAQAVSETSATYEEYVNELDRANKVANEGRLWDQQIPPIKKLTEAEWDQVKALKAIDDEYGNIDPAAKRWKDSLSETPAVIEPAVNATDELNFALKASKESTQELLADMYQYQLTLDGTFSDDDVQKVLNYQHTLGLLSDQEYDAAIRAEKLKTALENLPKNVDIDLFMNLYGSGLNYAGGSIAAQQKAQTPTSQPVPSKPSDWTPTNQQTGLDFTVPPNFESDNYPLNLRVKSGEHVKVETPDQQHAQGGGGGNGPLVGTVNNYSMWDREAASAWLRSLT